MIDNMIELYWDDQLFRGVLITGPIYTTTMPVPSSRRYGALKPTCNNLLVFKAPAITRYLRAQKLTRLLGAKNNQAPIHMRARVYDRTGFLMRECTMEHCTLTQLPDYQLELHCLQFKEQYY